MDIDERLERLKQRHQALTQTVKLLTRDIDALRVFTQGVAEGTARLLHIAQIRENRITGLEGGE